MRAPNSAVIVILVAKLSVGWDLDVNLLPSPVFVHIFTFKKIKAWSFYRCCYINLFVSMSVLLHCGFQHFVMKILS
jgi:hypothetical protein